MLRYRFFSFAVVLGIGLLLTLTLGLSALVQLADSLAQHIVVPSPALVKIVGHATIFAITAALFGLIYRYIPDVPISWGDVTIGPPSPPSYLQPANSHWHFTSPAPPWDLPMALPGLSSHSSCGRITPHRSFSTAPNSPSYTLSSCRSAIKRARENVHGSTSPRDEPDRRRHV